MTELHVQREHTAAERNVKHIKQSCNKNERTLGVCLEIGEPVW